MHFMRDNVLETVNQTIVPASASLVADRLFNNSYDFTGASETVTITFASAVSFQRLWLKTDGIVSWTATSGAVTIASATGIEDGEQSSFHTVNVINQTEVEFTFTKASGAAEGKVFEIMLMTHIFDLDSSQRPMRFWVEDMDPSASAYRTEDDTLASYAGESEGKAMVFIGWDWMPKSFTEQIRVLWKGPPLRRPFIIFPEPIDNPDDIYKVRYENNFRRTPTGESVVTGYTVNAILLEI